MEKRLKFITIGIIGVVCFSLLILYQYNMLSSLPFINDGENGNDTSDDNLEDKPANDLTLSVDYDNGTIDKWEHFDLEAGETSPFHAVDKWCNVEYEDYGANTYYVIKINGIGEGWNYYVNGVREMVPCNQFDLDDGDTIEWIYVGT